MSELNKNLNRLIENNIVVYDSQAGDGEFTSRLVSLIINTYRDNRTLLGVPEDAEITRFLVSRKVFFDNIGEIKVMAGLGIKIQYYTADYETQFIRQNCRLAFKDKHNHNHDDVSLVIGWDCHNQNGILGSC